MCIHIHTYIYIYIHMASDFALLPGIGRDLPAQLRWRGRHTRTFQRHLKHEMYICIYIYMYIYREREKERDVCVYDNSCVICVNIYIYIHIHIHKHVYIYIYIYIYKHLTSTGSYSLGRPLSLLGSHATMSRHAIRNIIQFEKM